VVIGGQPDSRSCVHLGSQAEIRKQATVCQTKQGNFNYDEMEERSAKDKQNSNKNEVVRFDLKKNIIMNYKCELNRI
jgi:hypothetical protein